MANDATPIPNTTINSRIPQPYPGITVGLRATTLLSHGQALVDSKGIATPVSCCQELGFPFFTVETKGKADDSEALLQNENNGAVMVNHIRELFVKANGESEARRAFDAYANVLSAVVTQGWLGSPVIGLESTPGLTGQVSCQKKYRHGRMERYRVERMERKGSSFSRGYSPNGISCTRPTKKQRKLEEEEHNPNDAEEQGPNHTVGQNRKDRKRKEQLILYMDGQLVDPQNSLDIHSIVEVKANHLRSRDGYDSFLRQMGWEMMLIEDSIYTRSNQKESTGYTSPTQLGTKSSRSRMVTATSASTGPGKRMCGFVVYKGAKKLREYSDQCDESNLSSADTVSHAKHQLL
ncbi:hypothetical protein N7465_006196 [Penicillium sp. CMV-2018d]|nr:hypothetical protein N7465_006196 [Penicillium sp. CMV-2018d]